MWHSHPCLHCNSDSWRSASTAMDERASVQQSHHYIIFFSLAVKDVMIPLLNGCRRGSNLGRAEGAAGAALAARKGIKLQLQHECGR